MNFFRLIVNHTRATLSIMLLILVAGAMSRVSMPVEMTPNVTLPVVMVMVPKLTDRTEYQFNEFF